MARTQLGGARHRQAPDQRRGRRSWLIASAVGLVTAGLAVTPSLVAAAAKSPEAMQQARPAAPAPQEPVPTTAPRWEPTWFPETGFAPISDEATSPESYELLLGINGSKIGPGIQVISVLDPQGRLGENRPGASSVTVRGHDAVLVPMINGTRVTWVEQPGLVLTVAVYGGLSNNVLMQVAESVVQS